MWMLILNDLHRITEAGMEGSTPCNDTDRRSGPPGRPTQRHRRPRVSRTARPCPFCCGRSRAIDLPHATMNAPMGGEYSDMAVCIPVWIMQGPPRVSFEKEVHELPDQLDPPCICMIILYSVVSR